MGSFWVDNAPHNTAFQAPGSQPAPPQTPLTSGQQAAFDQYKAANGPSSTLGGMPTNTGVTGGMSGGFQPQGPYSTFDDPPISAGTYVPPGSDPRVTTQPQPYQQGPGGTQGPVIGGLMPDGSFNANPYNYDKSQGPFIPDSQLGIDPNAGHVMGSGGQSSQGGGQGDPKSIALQYAQSLGPPSPENIQKTADYMKSLGYDVKANPGSDGFFLNGVGVDMVSNFKGGGQQNWQFLPDSPMGGGSLGNMGGGGFQTGTFTGGGKYPLASVMGTGLAQPWTTPFQAPNPEQIANDPSFKFQMEQGMNALQRSAASKGTLLTGGMLKGMEKYGQGLASTFDDKYYNRALGEYGQAYDIFSNNQGNLFNRLGTLSSIGENAAAGVGNAQIGLGNSQAAGSTNQGNIWGNAINNGGQTLNNAFQYLNQNRNQVPKPGSADPATFTGA